MESFFDIGARRWSPEAEKLTGIDFDELGINDIVATLKDERTNFDAILRDFGNKNPDEDPVIHFYELFLKEYDKQKRKSRGVYYTPQPVVSFIVRSVHEVLKHDFNLPLGLADTSTWADMMKKIPDLKLPKGVSEDEFFVQILDPAIGTGTFLVEAIDIIYKTMVDYWQSQGKSETEIIALWNRYIPGCLLPRVFGFELMMAPYAIAHMKIGIKLYETGYRNFQQDNERVRIYLTNTLEEPVDTTGYLDTLDPAMAEETRQANQIKRINSIIAIIGNPPYSGLSFNMNPWIDGLLKGQIPNGPKIRSYYEVDGKPLGERKLWLQDDYVKFIRYGQYRLDNTGVGVLALITNHAYLDNPTFRGLRQALLESFDNLHFTDLHGNAKKKEKAPDGSKDENVFDIQQGVGICLLQKTTDSEQSFVSYASFWGYRENKHKMLMQNIVYTTDASPLTPNSPFYFFVPQKEANRQEYEKGLKINEVMTENNVSIVTARDRLTIDFCPEVLWQRVKDFLSLSDEDARKKYELGKDVRDWKVRYAKESIKNEGLSHRNIREICYRPFDIRYVYYTKKSRGFIGQPAYKLMRHMLTRENLAMTVGRAGQVIDQNEWNIVFCTRNIAEFNLYRRGGNNLFPLYLYPEEDVLNWESLDWPPGKDGRIPNIRRGFVDKFTAGIGFEFVSEGKGDLRRTFGPEDIFNYVYAIFHSPAFRARYAEFLKTDFPRVPITTNASLLQQLTGLGNELVRLHLMESDKLDNPMTVFPIEGSNEIVRVGEKKRQLKDVENGKGKLYINTSQYFDNLPEEVWNFHIGGYQVCHKWLAERKKAGRKLSAEDIEHYHKIVVAINETIKIMNQIDEVIEYHGGWPIK
jgi:predicted helicase